MIQKELITPSGRAIRFMYTNYKGVTALRIVRPITLFWGSSEWHPKPGWLLRAWDSSRAAERTFALKLIHEWDPVSDPQPHMHVLKGGRGRLVLSVAGEGEQRRIHYSEPSNPGRARYMGSCKIAGWRRWCKGAERAWWCGESA